MRRVTVGIYCKIGNQRRGLPDISTASSVPIYCMYYCLLMAYPKKISSKGEQGGLFFFKKIKSGLPLKIMVVQYIKRSQG